MKLDHVAIAVNDLSESIKIYEKLFETQPSEIEKIESQSVNTIFFESQNNKIELLESTNPESPIAKFIEKKGEGLHHIAFQVDNIYSEIQRLKTVGFTIINETPTQGANNKLVVFLHPKTTNGVLIELCQEIK